MALAGLFGHRPIAQGVAYSAWVDTAHSGLASAAGTAVTLGFLWQAFQRTTAVRRAVAGLLAILCVALPLSMLLFPGLQGAIQRVMYASIFAWLWLYYPKRVVMQVRVGQGAASGDRAT